MQYTLILILLRGGGSIQSGLLSQVNLFSENSGVDTSSPFGFGLCSPYLKKIQLWLGIQQSSTEYDGTNGWLYHHLIVQ